MDTPGTFQEENNLTSLEVVCVLAVLVAPEGTNLSFAVLSSYRESIHGGWRWLEAQTKATETTNSFHLLSAARAGGNVL